MHEHTLISILLNEFTFAMASFKDGAAPLLILIGSWEWSECDIRAEYNFAVATKW